MEALLQTSKINIGINSGWSTHPLNYSIVMFKIKLISQANKQIKYEKKLTDSGWNTKKHTQKTKKI